jgi:hypothetical protein
MVVAKARRKARRNGQIASQSANRGRVLLAENGYATQREPTSGMLHALCEGRHQEVVAIPRSANINGEGH